jgi:hypothetical protein
MNYRRYKTDERLPPDDGRARAYLGGVTVAENDPAGARKRPAV